MKNRLPKNVTLDRKLIELVTKLAEQNHRSFSVQVEKLLEKGLLSSSQ